MQKDKHQKRNCIAIIDHVGIKAGMNYYDDGLMKAFSDHKIEAHIFSNFIGIYPRKVKYHEYFEGFTSVNLILQLMKFLKAIIRSSLKAKSISANYVIIHIFSGQLTTLLLVLIPRILGLRVNVIIHDVSSISSVDNKLIRYIIQNTLSENIIVHNEYAYQKLINKFFIKNKKKIQIIKHGDYIHLNQEISHNNESCFDFDSNKKYLLFFGQYKPSKGLNLLIDALTKIDNNVELVIAGRIIIKESDNIKNKIYKKNLNERVHIINRFINHEEMLHLFYNSDLLVLPYTKIFQSGVLMMAMSLKLPVLASDIEPFKQMIEHEVGGLLFNNLNENDLIKKIEKYIINDKLLSAIAQNAQKIIKDYYSWNDIAAKYSLLL